MDELGGRPSVDVTVLDRATLEREVERLVAAAEATGVTLRVLGSLAVALHCKDARGLIPSFSRTYADIDFAAYSRDAKALTNTLVSLGYVDDRDIHVTSEGRRSYLDDPKTRIHLDVFFDRLEFCHLIPLKGRLDGDRPTIPLAELLLSKLQIVRINEKDIVDVILLLLDHPLASGDHDVIDVDRIVGLASDDWGLWRTLTMNLDKVRGLVSTSPQLSSEQRSRAEQATIDLKARIDEAPKTLAWRMRARIGDRRQWWTDVEEVR